MSRKTRRTGCRLIIVSKEVSSIDEVKAMRDRMPSREDFKVFVVWDVDKPAVMAFLSLKDYMEREGINCNGKPPRSSNEKSA